MSSPQEAPFKKMTRAEAVATIDAIGERIRDIRHRMPEDSPNQMVAFQLASLIGEIQAWLNSDDCNV